MLFIEERDYSFYRLFVLVLLKKYIYNLYFLEKKNVSTTSMHKYT